MSASLRDYIESIVSVTDEEFDQILSCFVPMTVAKGEVLLQQENVCHYFYFVESGAIRMYTIRESGEESTRYINTEGQFGTALVSFMTHQPSFEAIQAIEKTELQRISYTRFYELTKKLPAWQQLYITLLERALQYNIFRLETFLTMDAHARYEWLTQSHPDFPKRFPVKMLSSFLGISRETLSRLRALP
ncbi:Crp/Fnr family transcriptional regulator [Phnomibacter sp. MR]|uniref:Crp/Fnr family transcriptional regulator n=1 Tax=Phnomibacter sp. MR TaxID=3042318 RepID=UPI003A809088